MSAVASLLERLAPAPDEGSRAMRGHAWLGAHGLPDPRDEAWRYTPLGDVVAALELARPAADPTPVIDRSVVDELAGDHGGARLVVVNGTFVPHLSTLDAAPAGISLGGADGVPIRRRAAAFASEDQPVDGFDALNWAAGGDVAAVRAQPDADADVPIHVVHVAVPDGGTTATHPATVVHADRGSRLHVIETFVGTGGPSLTNASTRIVAAEDAFVTYHRIVAEPRDAIHIGRAGIDQEARSTVRATSIITGGAIARGAIDVRLRGPEARVDLDGLYLPIGDQRHDNVITVDHTASRCTSTQRFKGIVGGRARGSFSGHVIVRPDTVGSDARQSNPNLVLTPTAQVDTRPWLEIFADDVRCTHGATVGRLDDDALFYLRSRGIPRARGRAMLVAAFAAEIIDAIAPASLRERVAASFDERMAGEGR